MSSDAREIVRLLEPHVTVLAPALLPAGRREGSEWRCGSIHGEAGKSLGVRLFGEKAGIWADFSDPSQKGDILDLIARCQCGGDMRSALAWARSFLGITDRVPFSPAAPPVRPAGAVQIDHRAEARTKAARSTFLELRPRLVGTPAWDYFKERRIDLALLGHQPRSLRFGFLYNAETGGKLPTLCAAVSNSLGQIQAIHRTWLARIEGRWQKAPLANPKKSFGPIAGGAIRIRRGASGKSLLAAPYGDSVAIAEGIETALSVAIACPELLVLAAVSLGNLGRIDLPAAIRTVILCADNDDGNLAASRAVQGAVDRYAREGRAVRIARSPVGSDFNDLLAAG